MIIVFVGTAGCGKTTLVKSFGEWLEREGYKVAYINLDPGAEVVPYSASFDVRSLVTTERLMKELGLGPNGAMIMAAKIMEEKLDYIIERVTSCNADYVLIDTPGQMELFVFRGLGPSLTSAIKNVDRAVVVYIVDAETMVSASEYLVVKLLSLIIELRLDVPTVTVINKGDVIDVAKMFLDVEKIKEGLSLKHDMLADLALELVDMLFKYEKPSRMVVLSALKSEGLDKLHDLILESFCVCGDLT